MKIVTLNTWGGIQDKIMFDWIKKQSRNTDIFCFQEIYDSIKLPALLGNKKEHHCLKQESKDLLTEYKCYYREHVYNTHMTGVVDFNLSYGLAIFVKNDLDNLVFDEGDILIYGAKTNRMSFEDPTTRNLQYLRLKLKNKILNVCNLHGIWIKDYGKIDHPARLE